MKELHPSFAPPEKWRNEGQSRKLEGDEWQRLRQKTLNRDNYTCVYCGYRSMKYQIIDHMDGDPENNTDVNLQVVCQMCNLIKHSGQGCAIKGIVDLYGKSYYGQADMIKITRRMRGSGRKDSTIIQHLGLKNKKPFKMNRKYLETLYGFVTSRSAPNKNDMYMGWLEYHKTHNKDKYQRILVNES